MPERWPTAYPEVNQIVDALIIGVKAALGDQLIGMYLSGSLAWGDFNPATSDIDFAVAIWKAPTFQSRRFVGTILLKVPTGPPTSSVSVNGPMARIGYSTGISCESEVLC